MDRPRRPLTKYENLAKTAYLDLLPWVVLGDVAISEVRRRKARQLRQ